MSRKVHRLANPGEVRYFQWHQLRSDDFCKRMIFIDPYSLRRLFSSPPLFLRILPFFACSRKGQEIIRARNRMSLST